VANVIAGNVSTVGNVSANYLLGNIWYATGYDTNYIFNDTSNISIPSPGGNANVTISGVANVVQFTPLGLSATGVVATTVSAVANVGAGNINTSGTFSIAGNVISQLNVTGNIAVSNITATGRVVLTSTAVGNTLQVWGNIATTNGYLLGNGAFITGITGGGGGVSNGATNITVPVASGNITFNIGGYSNTAVLSPGQLMAYGGFATPKNIGSSAFGNVSIGGNVNAILVGPITLATGFNLSVTDDSTAYVYGRQYNDFSSYTTLSLI
jgi:hypothetical protein